MSYASTDIVNQQIAGKGEHRGGGAIAGPYHHHHHVCSLTNEFAEPFQVFEGVPRVRSDQQKDVQTTIAWGDYDSGLRIDLWFGFPFGLRSGLDTG
jgi:hypothetical protein